MSLENIKGKMNRNEMRNIMAGSSGSSCCAYTSNWQNSGFTCI